MAWIAFYILFIWIIVNFWFIIGLGAKVQTEVNKFEFLFVAKATSKNKIQNDQVTSNFLMHKSNALKFWSKKTRRRPVLKYFLRMP